MYENLFIQVYKLSNSIIMNAIVIVNVFGLIQTLDIS
jgi:hypothetical protein